MKSQKKSDKERQKQAKIMANVFCIEAGDKRNFRFMVSSSLIMISFMVYTMTNLMLMERWRLFQAGFLFVVYFGLLIAFCFNEHLWKKQRKELADEIKDLRR